MSRPPFDDKRPGTFSKMVHRGWRSSRSLTISKKSPERLPAKPARRPATERSWHGNPPQMIPSEGSNPTARSCSPVTSVTSLNRCVFGNRCAKTPDACLSISTAATTGTPARSSARSNPPTPANNETAFTPSPRRAPIHRVPCARCPCDRPYSACRPTSCHGPGLERAVLSVPLDACGLRSSQSSLPL